MSPLALAGGRVELGRAAVLPSVDFELGTAEFVALLGANGSGKTTLVRALVGLVPLAAGELRLFGTPVGRFRDWHRLGYVPQRLAATTGVPATVREVVASGRTPLVRPWRRFGADDHSAVASALATVDLRDRAGDPVRTLSGGQQQRVLIARALAGTPEALVLDEPTAGVDAASQEALAAALAAAKERGVAVLLVTHHLGDLAPLVDRCVVLAHGDVVYDGPPPASGMAADDHHHPEPFGEAGWELR